MKHILGMAKSNLDLRGAKAPKLELDVLRLIVAVRTLRETKQEADGYVLVLHANVGRRVAVWLEKYQANDCVQCYHGELSQFERIELRDEKRRNAGAIRMVERTRARQDGADASRGRDLGERELLNLILAKEPSVIEAARTKKRPLSVNWDFYGTVAGGDRV